MKNTNFPPGWNEERVRRVLQYYESLTEEEAVAEEEANFTITREMSPIVPKCPIFRKNSRTNGRALIAERTG